LALKAGGIRRSDVGAPGTLRDGVMSWGAPIVRSAGVTQWVMTHL
jgi:hypothetical protein